MAAADAGSISGAARTLGQPRATLSRQLSRLEARLGVRLVHRDTHRFDLTAAGQALYPRALRVVSEANEAIEAVRRIDDVPRGILRVGMPPMAETAVDALVLDFARQWPEVQLELHVSTAHVDVRAMRMDVALRVGPASDPALIARTLARIDRRLFASAEYLRRRGRPTDPAQLDEHALILGFDASGRVERAWPLLEGGTIPVRAALSADDASVRRRAAIRGLGLAMLPVWAQVNANLEPVLSAQVGDTARLALVYPERTYLLPKVRAFVDHVVAWFEAGAAKAAGR